MNDLVKPEWMKKRQAEQEATTTEQELRRQRADAAALLIDRDGEKFWKDLKEKLAIAVEFLPDLKLEGLISPQGKDALRIAVSKPGVFLNQTYTDIFYNRDAKQLRCGLLNKGIYNLMFCVTGDGRVMVNDLRDSGTMNADGAAQHIMELMIDQIESQ